MSKGRILVVEDDVDIANMLRIYFSSQGYETTVAGRGREALDRCKQQLPHVVVLDIMLPDIDGYEVCTQLRTNLRTSHIPIIFLTQKDERSDKIAGLELGADDYVTKPFDIEELRLRVQGAIRRAERESLTNPTTGLPSGKLIEEQLRLLMRKKGWGLLYIGISSLEPFNDKYGFVARDEVLRFTALLLGEMVDQHGTSDDFIGHIGGDDFLIIAPLDKTQPIADATIKRFNEEVKTHYDFRDREAGALILNNQRYPFMTLAIGTVDSTQEDFSDIREITEVAAEARRRTQA
jgi:PleD family two-component response regulator